MEQPAMLSCEVRDSLFSDYRTRLSALVLKSTLVSDLAETTESLAFDHRGNGHGMPER